MTAGERTFLVEYEGEAAQERASVAAARLNAFLAGAGAPAITETVGSRAVAWGLVGGVLALIAGIGAAYGAVRRRWGPPAPNRERLSGEPASS